MTLSKEAGACPMNEQEKQALIVQIRNYLQAVDNNSTIFTHVSVFHDMARIALAALTAPPAVNLAELVPSGDELRSEAEGYGTFYSSREKSVFIEGGIWVRAEMLRRIEESGKC